MKNFYFGITVFALTLITAAPMAEAHNLGPIVRKGSVGADKFCPEDAKGGAVCEMTQYKAKEYCESIQSRLPTARELAVFSQELGAKGISETAKEGYYQIEAKNEADGTVDSFYFDYSGYRRPDGDLGNYWFWSSSVLPVGSVDAFALDGYDGYIDDAYRSYGHNYAVRCVR